MFFIPVAILIGLDQFFKNVIERSISYSEQIQIINGFFYITHTTNTGAAWGMLQGMNIVFIPVTIVVTVIISLLMLKNKSLLFRISGILILSGAIGNLIDRIFRPMGVVDYLEFHFGSYVFPIFNLADIFVVCGSILLGIYVLFFYDRKEKI